MAAAEIRALERSASEKKLKRYDILIVLVINCPL